ncbi:HAD family phosphatase [Kaistia dalseonensis]|uniref:HAD superfamily hydrolase (TIGR01509 family) n=1 Tax=Kaistia dalseonensis TaxID=410840 RepID=A0ABU0HCR3_9HYPH|nr:HAD family phosphatase [Kaistia dalseonensis]MCX5497469.1 HAD family phosphatase [Kaistia dalseonensis]MDQ0440108.1 HAD superfamily hydrolase (TIGR01509 family) [Kaistia dalseonensis]
MAEIRHIVFDIGNVLIRWQPELLYTRLIPDEAARKAFLANVLTHEWNLEQDRGRSWEEAEAEAIAAHPEHETLIRAWRKDWHDMIPGPIDETVIVLDQLIENGHDVTALTNFAEDTFAEAVARFPYLDTFRGVTVSARIKLVKPDIAIYDHHARSFDLDPAATLFFDDMPVNIEAARKAGWNAEQFVDAETMRADLARYGVKLG